jgi:quercetin dioxygenase-like cupin family protein
MIKVSLAPFHSFNYAGATVQIYHADKEEGLKEHSHTWNHATVCHSGSCLVRVNGKEIVLNPNSQPIDLPANVVHEIESLEDKTVFMTVFEQGKY